MITHSFMNHNKKTTNQASKDQINSQNHHSTMQKLINSRVKTNSYQQPYYSQISQPISDHAFGKNYNMQRLSASRLQTNSYDNKHLSIQKQMCSLTQKINQLTFKVDSHDIQLKSTKKSIDFIQIKKLIRQQLEHHLLKENFIDQLQIKKQIQLVKGQLTKFTYKDQFDMKIFDLQFGFKENSSKIEANFRNQILKLTERQMRLQKKQMEQINKNLRQTISKTNSTCDMAISDVYKAIQTISSSQSISIQKPISFNESKTNIDMLNPTIHNKALYLKGKHNVVKYTQHYSIIKEQGQESVKINQIYYKVDKDGFLLDENEMYILDYKNSPIKLNTRHINFLKKNKMLL